jgi:hypothetical protein
MAVMRAACYARYSSDLQRESSIDDQLAMARRYAEAQGWTVMPAWVRQQLEDIVGLLQASPERTKVEFQRLQLNVTMASMTPEGARPFYRATVESELPGLTGVTKVSGAPTRSTADRLGQAERPAKHEKSSQFRRSFCCGSLGPSIGTVKSGIASRSTRFAAPSSPHWIR